MNSQPLPKHRPDDSTLIASYCAGDEEALSRVERWVRALLIVRYRVLRGDWSDLIQTVHAKLLTNLERGAFGHESSLKTYVQRIAHYSAIDQLRRRHRERGPRSPHEPSSDAGPYAVLIHRERADLLHAALHLTSAECLALWRKTFLEKLTYEQIATRLQIPLGTVKSRMWHCRKKLRATLRRLEGGGIDTD